MRRGVCVPMMVLCLLLSGCGGGGEAQKQAAAVREPYQTMTGCTMEAEVTCGVGSEDALTFSLRCDYVPEGETDVEVLAPETVAGVKAVISGDDLTIQYGDGCLNAGTLSTEKVSPVDCLPRLISALRSGWLLEQNRETMKDVPCLRLCLDQTTDSGKILSTVWLRQDDGTPVYGEITVNDEIILRAEFTSFEFCDILQN